MDIDVEIDNFAHKFLGYGNLNSPLWFIGMEEGGGNSKEEIELRLSAWKDLNRPSLADIADFHERIGERFLFSGKVKLQKTWSKLIAFHLATSGKDFNKEDIRIYQRDHLGRHDSDNALLELMPLPSPGIDKWHYNIFSTLPYLTDRKTYFNTMINKRIDLLNEQIEIFKPKTVLFYGLGYLDYWMKIANVTFECHPDGDIYSGQKDGTQFIAVKHPVSFLKTGYYEGVGRIFSQMKKDKFKG